VSSNREVLFRFEGFNKVEMVYYVEGLDKIEELNVTMGRKGKGG